MSIDLGSVSETLFESEMFGYTAGAFTDAKTDRQGRMEASDKGTLFLDEVSNLPLNLQSKLLQVLQNRQITRLGSTNVVDIDIRLISASNKNIHKLIQNGIFREDLFYRLNTVEILLPPLREREYDIVLLAECFLKEFSGKYYKPGLRINENAKNKLMNYNWPGNVRELRHIIENAVIMADKKNLGPEEFTLKGILSRNLITARRPTFSDIEKLSIQDALEHNNGSVIKAAKELGLARQTLYNKIVKYNMDIKS
ncbi:sigma 54-interacting transcriptional regulator [Bacteroidota bacterium]